MPKTLTTTAVRSLITIAQEYGIVPARSQWKASRRRLDEIGVTGSGRYATLCLQKFLQENGLAVDFIPGQNARPALPATPDTLLCRWAA